MTEFYNLARDGVTQSLLGKFIHCRQSAKFYVEGWKRPGVNIAFAAGNIFHEALDAIYSERIKTKNKVLKVPDAYRIGVTAMEEQTKKELKNVIDPEDREKIEQERSKMAALLQGYLVRWNEQDLKRGTRWTRSESEFNIELYGVRLRGKIDQTFKSGGVEILLDTKTAGRLDEAALVEKLSFDFQMLFYLTVLDALTGKENHEIIYNVVKKPEIRPRKGEDWSAFILRLQQDAIERTEFYFRRYSLRYSDDEKDAFKMDLRAILEEFTDWTRGDMATYRNCGACMGRWNCEYLQACASNSTDVLVRSAKLFEELES